MSKKCSKQTIHERLSFYEKVIGVSLCIFMLDGCMLGTRHGKIVLIPQNYVGWIRLKSAVKGATPLPIQNGSYLVRVPANGLLKTSTIEEEGWGTDSFYYVTKNGSKICLLTEEAGNQSLIWGEAGRTNEDWMFIGTKKQWSDTERLIGGYDPGPLKLPITAPTAKSSNHEN